MTGGATSMLSDWVKPFGNRRGSAEKQKKSQLSFLFLWSRVHLPPLLPLLPVADVYGDVDLFGWLGVTLTPEEAIVGSSSSSFVPFG